MDGHDSEDSKQSTADMTVFVQNLLQQMQNRFQTMSDSIVTKNILFPYVEFDVKIMLKWGFFGVLNFNVLDEMGGRINELEQSINDLRAEMGVEGSPSPLAPSKTKPGDEKPEEGSA
ncbi:hypothetical protein JRO89_XS01G0372900 [Xanthoceras sorbifolium]|uniref:Heat shock factor-binding protein 1 n=1 Tax=Xanthoceras sorbifolium TaxID=99658 RepID=A0ABQ8IPT6_9ROSI|nr:hypothetical protein JRO89_XS01G0372900 [Xanthoceras sorbifolium]